MRKRFFQSVSVVLTLTMVFIILTCAPFASSAAETGGDNSTQAVAAAAEDPFGRLSGGKYTLESTTYQLTADFAARGYLYVPSDVNATIDLNGHTIDRELTEVSATGYVIKNDGTLTITDSSGDDSGKITGGYAERGGAVNNSGTLTISGGDLCNNKASVEGGAIINNSGASLTVSGGKITHNGAMQYGGGAILNSGTATVSGGTIFGNTATMNGAGIWNGNGAILNLTGGIISANRPGESHNGGAIYLNTGTVNMTACFLNNNNSADTGAVFVNSNANAFNATNSTFINNKSTSYGGGAIAAYADMALKGCTIGQIYAAAPFRTGVFADVASVKVQIAQRVDAAAGVVLGNIFVDNTIGHSDRGLCPYTASACIRFVAAEGTAV